MPRPGGSVAGGPRHPHPRRCRRGRAGAGRAAAGLTTFDVVILAGGSARRLGGVDKPGLEVGGTALLDRVLAACSLAARLIVVGPSRPTCVPVTWTREDPVGGGPVPALAAGLQRVTADRVLVLAGDLPFCTDSAASMLVDRAPAVLLGDGQVQWLCGAWPTAALRDSLTSAASPRLRDVLAPLDPALVTWDGDDRPWQDCDTEADLRRAREQADERTGRVGVLSR